MYCSADAWVSGRPEFSIADSYESKNTIAKYRLGSEGSQASSALRTVRLPSVARHHSSLIWRALSMSEVRNSMICTNAMRWSPYAGRGREESVGLSVTKGGHARCLFRPLLPGEARMKTACARSEAGSPPRGV